MFASFRGSAKAEVSITVPRDVAMKFGVVTADALVTGLRNDAKLSTVSGDLVSSTDFLPTICEAAGNAIEHAYGPGDATFDVEARLDARELVATVSDRGHWRERRGAHRGRGLNIIEGLMDKVEVSTEQEGTVVRMSRRLGASRAA